MKTFFIGTSNAGKQKEIEKYAALYGNDVRVVFPDDVTTVHVDETGATFEENALLKAQAYQRAIGDPSLVYIGDDSGISIPAIGGEPGVHTRRWAGYEMTDDEILHLCLEKMAHLKGDERKAVFETVLAVLEPGKAVRYLHGVMKGHILEEPLAGVEPQPGFPFRSIFWVDGIEVPIFEVHALSAERRQGFLTHREDAFKQLFAGQLSLERETVGR